MAVDLEPDIEFPAGRLFSQTRRCPTPAALQHAPTNRKVHKKKMQIIPFILTTFVTRLDSKISPDFTLHVYCTHSESAITTGCTSFYKLSLARYSSLSRYASCPHRMFS